MEKESSNKLLYAMIVVAVAAILAAIFAPSLVYYFLHPGNPSGAIGPSSFIRQAQEMYKSKFNTYGTFGELYNAGLLDAGLLADKPFDVESGTIYKYTYTYTLTVTSSSSWYCVAVPDDSNARWIKFEEAGEHSFSEDQGKTWYSTGQ